MRLGLNWNLQGCLAPGVEAADIPVLFGLLKGRPWLEALIALFRGGEEEVLLRLLVLKTLAARAEAPAWGAQDIRAMLGFLDPAKLESTLKRLRDHELLLVNEQGETKPSPIGRSLLTALNGLFRFARSEDDDLGYLTAQLAANEAVGVLDPETLEHLLARLTELQNEFEQAVVLGSEFLIRAAQDKRESVWHWVERSIEVIRRITEDEDLSPHAHRLAQRIGQVQSRMLKISSAFERSLNRLEQARVQLGSSGVSSSEVSAWLRQQSAGQLHDLAAGALRHAPQAVFVTPQEMLDIAEFEWLDKKREAIEITALPPPQALAVAENLPQERHFAAEILAQQLATIVAPTPLPEVALGPDYPHTAYRLALIAMMQDRSTADAFADLPRLQDLALQLHADTAQRVDIHQHDVAWMSGGTLAPLDTSSSNA